MSLTSEWPVSEAGYQKLDLIGYGAFAKVFKARVLQGPNAGTDVAIKVIDLEQFPDSTMEEIRRELTTMKLCNHPGAMNYNIAFIVKTELWLVMQLFGGGSCLAVMRAAAPHGIKDMDIVAYILREVLVVLKYFHSNQLLHRDLKAGNILLSDADARVVIADFGVAASLKDTTVRTTFVGTPCWMAPEVLEQSKGYDWRADIWSLGITAIELASGEAPFQRLPPMKVMLLVLQSEPTRLDAASGWDASFAALVNMCLQKDPANRPSAGELLDRFAPFFARADNGRVKLQALLKSLKSLPERTRGLSQVDFIHKPGNNMANGGDASKNKPAADDFDWDFGDDVEAKAAKAKDAEDPLDALGETDL